MHGYVNVKRNIHNKDTKEVVPKTAPNINEKEIKNSNAVRECQNIRRPASISTVSQNVPWM
jgi:hypothetical protein